MHYYAGIYQSKWFEHDELVNEAWIAVRNLDRIEFASQGIRWAMLTYIKKERAKAHKGSKKAVICSIDDVLLKIIIKDPKNFLQTIEDSDLVSGILIKSGLDMKDRILIDLLYFRGWTQKKIAELRGCTRQNINMRLDIILEKLNRVAMEK